MIIAIITIATIDHFMKTEKKYLAATLEALSLYVDLDERKVVEFEKEKVDLMKEFISKNSKTFKIENLKFSSKLKR